MENQSNSYKTLESEIKPYINMMSQASDSIRNQDISKYPIFVLHKTQLPFGLPLVEKEKLGGKWSVHASTLEEFATKQLIEQDKVDDFRSVYKDPKSYLCLFIIRDEAANFIFIPRPVNKV